MATTTIDLNSEQQFSEADTVPSLDELDRLHRLSGLVLQGAEAMTRISLAAFELAREGEARATPLGRDCLDCAERFYARSRVLMADAEALAARLRA